MIGIGKTKKEVWKKTKQGTTYEKTEVSRLLIPKWLRNVLLSMGFLAPTGIVPYLVLSHRFEQPEPKPRNDKGVRPEFPQVQKGNGHIGVGRKRHDFDLQQSNFQQAPND